MVLALSVVAGILGFVGTASAATVSVSGAITLTAGSGDTDDVAVTKTAFGYEISDTAGATPGTGCSTVTSTKVLCATSITGQITLNLGNQLDQVTIDDTLPQHLRVTINGEADGVTVLADDAVNPILVNATAGSVATGSASDTLNVGSATYTGKVQSGDGDDHVNLTTNLPNGADTENGTGCLYGHVETCDPIDMEAGDGDDHVVMSSSATGAMYYTGEGGNDIVFGGGGADGFALQEDDGDDWYLGGAGGDHFYAYGLTGSTHDRLFGEAGNDHVDMWEENGHVMFDGGPGTDTVFPHFSGASTLDIQISLDGVMNDGEPGVLHDNYMGNVENIQSIGPFSTSKNDGDDTLSGNADANVIDGNGGEDEITGYAGSDTLRGGAGDDVINAEDGEVDTIDCGADTDVVYADGIDSVNGNCETVI